MCLWKGLLSLAWLKAEPFASIAPPLGGCRRMTSFHSRPTWLARDLHPTYLALTGWSKGRKVPMAHHRVPEHLLWKVKSIQILLFWPFFVEYSNLSCSELSGLPRSSTKLYKTTWQYCALLPQGQSSDASREKSILLLCLPLGTRGNISKESKIGKLVEG